MKRYASHFIFIPGYGYLKQYVVEVKQGSAVSVFPLTEEIEGVEWFPGVIALLDERDSSSAESHGIFQKQKDIYMAICKKEAPQMVSLTPDHQVACHLYTKNMQK